MATTNIPMDRALAAELRRLTGARTSREALAKIARDFVRRRRVAKSRANGKSETEAERIARVAEQDRRIQKAGDAVRAMGDPFYPGFDYRKLREEDDRKMRERWGNDWPWPEDDSAK